jgi:sterol desaturase/sphingolipid hydroxylase (fatty acid hydroxylase superfamily)
MGALFQYEAGIRLGCFAGVFALMALWELLAPRRAPVVRKPLRWGSNLGLVFLSSFVLRLAAPLGAVGVAMFSESRGWGLFQAIDGPYWIAVAGSVLLLDLAIYLQHVMFHAVPLFWRLHMVHHSDLDFDVTTGLRFHTIEILLSFGIKAGVILLLGAPAVAVLIFEVLLNATSMFNHSNVRMPLIVDRIVRWLVVTPDMHRVHHSRYAHETNSNFGFNLPWWDRLFGTYRDQPTDGHTAMTIGLSQFPDERRTERLHWMLWLPFGGETGDYPINRRQKQRSAEAQRAIGNSDQTKSANGDAPTSSMGSGFDPANKEPHPRA